MKLLLLINIMSIAVLSACQSTNSQSAKQMDTLSSTIGNDRDSSGCVGSAGFVWSTVKQTCVRPWEEGVMLLNVNTGNTHHMAAYLVFDEQHKKVEIFMAENNLVLPQTADGHYSNGNFRLEKDSTGWAVRFNERLLYQQEI